MASTGPTVFKYNPGHAIGIAASIAAQDVVGSLNPPRSSSAKPLCATLGQPARSPESSSSTEAPIPGPHPSLGTITTHEGHEGSQTQVARDAMPGPIILVVSGLF